MKCFPVLLLPILENFWIGRVLAVIPRCVKQDWGGVGRLSVNSIFSSRICCSLSGVFIGGKASYLENSELGRAGVLLLATFCFDFFLLIGDSLMINICLCSSFLRCHSSRFLLYTAIIVSSIAWIKERKNKPKIVTQLHWENILSIIQNDSSHIYEYPPPGRYTKAITRWFMV